MEGISKAVEFAEEAVAIDPDYALAYAELSTFYTALINYSILDPKEYLPKAESAAQKALELDASLANAHFALAATKEFSWDWAFAEREFKRAIELNPNLAEAHLWYARYLSFAARHDEAIVEIMQARRLDPLSPSINSHIGMVPYFARQHTQANEGPAEIARTG
jgi:tetratricopeptide (TPR) repeat protein